MRPAKRLLFVALSAFLALPVQAQESRGTGNTRITLEGENGEPLVITVEDGSVLINGASVFEFDANSELGSVISSFLQAGSEGISDEGFNLSAFVNQALAEQGLMDLEPVLAEAVGGGSPFADGFVTGQTRRPDADTPQATPGAVSISGPSGPSIVQIFAGLIAMLGMAFGVAHFFPKQFDILSTTISDASGKSFLAGVFSLPLIPVVVALTIAGLILTVVGILVVPFALMGVVLLTGVLGLVFCAGYLACARALGHAYTQRKSAHGGYVESGPFRNTMYGLVGLMSVWIPAAIVGWVPVMGDIALVLAWAVTLAAITTGWGAAVLSRQELRESLIKGGRRSLTDEFRVVSAGR